MRSSKIQNYLEKHHVNYQIIEHDPVYTAQEIAAISHISGKNFAKTVIIKVDGKLIMLVEPANMRIDLGKLKKLMGAKHIELAHEYEFQNRFPDCETGAMPPLGELFDMDVYMTESMNKDRDIAFNAGSHSETLKMSYKNFIDLVKPHMLSTRLS